MNANDLPIEPLDKSAAISEMYSYPDSAIAQRLSRQDELYGWLKLKYYNNLTHISKLKVC